METLTYEEYQKKISSLKNPEDVAAFLQELAAPALAAVQANNAAPTVETPKKTKASKSYVFRPAQKRYESAENETEEKVIGLYAKGLTTRDISLYMKEHHGLVGCTQNIL